MYLELTDKELGTIIKALQVLESTCEDEVQAKVHIPGESRTVNEDMDHLRAIRLIFGKLGLR